MTTDGQTSQRAPQAYARVAGVLYLFIIVAALFAEMFVRGKIIVRGDAAATAANLIASETLFRAGLAGEAITWLCDVTVALIFYVLLRPVSRNLALLAAFHRVAFVGAYACSKFFLVAAVIVLQGDYLRVFEPQQQQALSYLFIRLHSFGYGMSLLFFGFHCAVIGYLIFRSRYLPRTIGAMLVIAGVCYLTHSLVQMIDPVLASRLFPWILLPAFPAELGLALWLLVKGINVAKWEERVDAGPASLRNAESRA